MFGVVSKFNRSMLMVLWAFFYLFRSLVSLTFGFDLQLFFGELSAKKSVRSNVRIVNLKSLISDIRRASRTLFHRSNRHCNRPGTSSYPVVVVQEIRMELAEIS